MVRGPSLLTSAPPVRRRLLPSDGAQPSDSRRAMQAVRPATLVVPLTAAALAFRRRRLERSPVVDFAAARCRRRQPGAAVPVAFCAAARQATRVASGSFHARRRLLVIWRCLFALVACQGAMAARRSHGFPGDKAVAEAGRHGLAGDDADTADSADCRGSTATPDLGKLPTTRSRAAQRRSVPRAWDLRAGIRPARSRRCRRCRNWTSRRSTRRGWTIRPNCRSGPGANAQPIRPWLSRKRSARASGRRRGAAVLVRARRRSDGRAGART